MDVREPDIDIDLVAVVCRRVSFRRFLRHLPGVLSAADGVSDVHTVEGRVGHLSMNVNGVDVDVLLARLPYVTAPPGCAASLTLYRRRPVDVNDRGLTLV